MHCKHDHLINRKADIIKFNFAQYCTYFRLFNSEEIEKSSSVILTLLLTSVRRSSLLPGSFASSSTDSTMSGSLLRYHKDSKFICAVLSSIHETKKLRRGGLMTMLLLTVYLSLIILYHWSLSIMSDERIREHLYKENLLRCRGRSSSGQVDSLWGYSQELPSNGIETVNVLEERQYINMW